MDDVCAFEDPDEDAAAGCCVLPKAHYHHPLTAFAAASVKPTAPGRKGGPLVVVNPPKKFNLYIMVVSPLGGHLQNGPCEKRA